MWMNIGTETFNRTKTHETDCGNFYDLILDRVKAGSLHIDSNISPKTFRNASPSERRADNVSTVYDPALWQSVSFQRDFHFWESIKCFFKFSGVLNKAVYFGPERLNLL